ncbi:MAG: NAD(P)/FAD-dependent oxidoreductase [bacterium]
MELKHVVIVGGGFAGLAAAKALATAPVRITLIDKENHHLFQPLLYQVATSALSSPDIAAPIRKVLRRQSNVTTLLSEVSAISLETQTVEHTYGSMPYDYLILAAGAVNDYFGHDHWEERAPGLKSLADALEIRHRVLTAFEKAEAVDASERASLLTFAVIGAGPTGVEMAGALKEIATRTLNDNFRNFDPSKARVVLIEGGPRVLSAFPEDLSANAQMQLEKLGVEVLLNTRVKDITEHGVDLENGDAIAAATVLWGAGVKGSPLAKTLGVELDRRGRVPVGKDFALPDHPNVFVVGDLAQCVDAKGEEVPGLAPAASQGGEHVAAQIWRSIDGKDRQDFTYLDKGIMATIGRSRAVAVSGPFKFTGGLAWLAWLFIHVLFLIDFRNRIAVIFEWAWAYVTFQRSARVILTREKKPVVAG